MGKETCNCGKNSQLVEVDLEKISQGLKKVFLGCAEVFDALGAESSLVKEQQEKAEEQIKETKVEEEVPPPKKQEAASITSDDIIKIASAKITADRKNSQKIQKLIETYGVKKISEIPAEKYEAFLTELSAL